MLRIFPSIAYSQMQSEPGNGDSLRTASVETVADFAGRGLAVASTSPIFPWLPARMRKYIGHEFKRAGNVVLFIEVSENGIELIPVAHWEVVHGGFSESSWVYRLTIAYPRGMTTRLVPSSGVVHIKENVSPHAPWMGIPGWRWASDTSAINANSDKRLSEESSGQVSRVIPLPKDPGSVDGVDTLEGLKTSLGKGGGKAYFVETVMGGFDAGRASAPLNDWKQQRLGPEPPSSFNDLRSDAEAAIMVAMGLPRALTTAADGTALREGIRQAVMIFLEPMGEVIADELSKKMELSELKFDFKSIWGHDLSGRSKAFKDLITGGMDITRAANLSGLLAMEGGE